MRLKDRLVQALDEGELLGRFALSDGSIAATEAPGVLRWDPEDGADLRLIGPLEGWPERVGGDPLTIHGTTDRGDELALLHAWPRSRVWGGAGSLVFHSPTLVARAHVDEREVWNRATFRTANLHEWVGRTGIEPVRHDTDARGKANAVEVRWTPPESWTVAVAGGQLTLGPRMETEYAFAPDWSIRTGYEFHVRADDPLTIDDFLRCFLRPARTLAVFASARPDALISEAYGTPGRETVIVMRQGPKVAAREWRPDERYLFRVDDLSDVEDALVRWFALYRQCGPALDGFAETIAQDSVFSPARLVTLAAALEAYHRETVSRNASGLRRLTELQEKTGLHEVDTGCSPASLRALIEARNHAAHLNRLRAAVDEEGLSEVMFDSIRRGQALMQACLLRDVGFSATEAHELLLAHYRSWPLPDPDPR